MTHNPAIKDGILYLNNGREDLDGSERMRVNTELNVCVIEKRVGGIWQPASLELGSNTLWIGRNVKIGGVGHHVVTETADGSDIHLLAHNKFDGQIATEDIKIATPYSYSARVEYQPDNSGTWTGTEQTFQIVSPAHLLANDAYFQTDTTAASEPIRYRIYHGASESGTLIFDQTYPASEFPASTEIQITAIGYLEFDTGETYFHKITSDASFSLKMDTTNTTPWIAADTSYVREDNLLQTKPWVSGDSWDSGDYFIDERTIYVCNTTGEQTGTFASNSAKWDEISHHAGINYWTKTGDDLSYTTGDVGIGHNLAIGAYHDTTNSGLQVHARDGAGLTEALRLVNWYSSASTATGIMFSNVSSGYAKGGIFFENDGGGYARGPMHFSLSSASTTADCTIAEAVMTLNYDGSMVLGTDGSRDGSITLLDSGSHSDPPKIYTDSNASLILEAHSNDGDIINSIDGYRGYFRVKDQTETELFSIKYGSGDTWIKGNLGVGIVAEHKLHVAGNTYIAVDDTSGGDSATPAGAWIHNSSSGDSSLSFSAGAAVRWSIFPDANGNNAFKFYNETNSKVLAITIAGDIEMQIADSKLISSDDKGYFQLGSSGDVLWYDVDNTTNRFEINTTATYLRSPDGNTVIDANDSKIQLTSGTSGIELDGSLIGLNNGTSSIALNSADILINNGTNSIEIDNSDTTVTGPFNVSITSDIFTVNATVTTVKSAAGLLIEQSSSGDALLGFLVTDGQHWSTGIDNTDADKFKIAHAINLDSNVILTLTTDGHVGINKTDPNKELYVNGKGEFNSTIATGSTLTVHNDSLSTGNLAYFYSNSDNVSSRTLFKIINDHADAVNTKCMSIQQDADEHALDIVANGIDTGEAFKIQGDNLTFGGLAYFLSNSDDDSHRHLVGIHNDHISAVNTSCLKITNDAAGPGDAAYGIYLAGCSLNVDAGGDIYVDGGNIEITGTGSEIIVDDGADILVDGATSSIVLANGADLLLTETGNLYMTNGHLGWTSNGSFSPPHKTQAMIDAFDKQPGMMFWNTTYTIMQVWDGSSLRNLW